MSTISEVDIRDWESVNISSAKESLARVIEWDCSDPSDDIEFNRLWSNFYTLLSQVELLRDKQIKAATKQIPALFKPLVDAVNRGE